MIFGDYEKNVGIGKWIFIRKKFFWGIRVEDGMEIEQKIVGKSVLEFLVEY